MAHHPLRPFDVRSVFLPGASRLWIQQDNNRLFRIFAGYIIGTLRFSTLQCQRFAHPRDAEVHLWQNGGLFCSTCRRPLHL
jgi:hypothetical protein